LEGTLNYWLVRIKIMQAPVPYLPDVQLQDTLPDWQEKELKILEKMLGVFKHLIENKNEALSNGFPKSYAGFRGSSRGSQ
jgi:hypothetical protein